MSERQPIRFGTDGWRGIVADDYTFANVRRAALAIAAYVHQFEDASRPVLVAYDTRFNARGFAQVAAEALASTGLAVQLAREITPTPALSYMVRQCGAAGGVMITSSHNPWNWNGVKFKAAYGGAGSPAIMQKIEALLDGPTIHGSGTIVEADFTTDYIGAVKRFVDLAAIARARQKFAIDAMYGAGQGILRGIFAEIGVDCVEIHGMVDPLFPGLNPEPIMPHLQGLCEAVVAHRCQAGLATDGDADRIGAVDENGHWVDAHKCFAVLLEWLLKRKPWPGVVTRAFNTTRMLDRICRAYGRSLIEHGVGFKHVAEIIQSGQTVLIGGEESGGIGVPRFLPERDGTLNALLLANAMADEGKTLGQLVEELQQKYGRHYYGRRDLPLDEERQQRALRRAAASPKQIGGYRVERLETLDGYKFFLDAPHDDRDAEAWLLLRGSGTEPLLRIYCEAAAPETVEAILNAAVAFANAE